VSFLNPWVALAVASVVIPALLILYFLKLRRRPQAVPSTLLWRRAVQDLQVNAPFQRLRKNLLLLLQLLVLAAGIVALARPVVQSQLAQDKSVILLIDRSASMNARETGGRTRLELAKEQAVRLVRTLNRAGSRWFSFGTDQEATRVMVIAFADRATIVSPFTTNTAGLPALIEAIEPSDARTNLREALELAEAYTQVTRVEMRPNVEEAASRIVLLSDGAIADLEDLLLRTGTMEHIRIGETRDNVGITALRVERNYERPELVQAFLQVRNFGPQPAATDATLYVSEPDGRMRLTQVQPLSLAAAPSAEPPGGAAPAGPSGEPARSSAALSFELVLERAAVLEVRLSREDALPADDRAYGIVAPPRKLRVLLVSKGNLFLESVLAGLPLEQVVYWTPQQYESRPEAELADNGRLRYDVAILDKHETARLPAGNYLFLSAVPQIDEVKRTGELGYHSVLWWDETHAMLRHVAMEQIVAARGLTIQMPREAEVIAEGPQGPVLVRYSREGRQFVILTFGIEDTTWWQKPGFPMFAYNVLRYLAAGGGAEGGTVRPGDVLRIPLPAGTASATLTLPNGSVAAVRPDADGVARYAGTSRVGLYRVSPGLEGRERFAVNLEDARESDITPRGELKIGGTAVAQGEAIRTATPEVWRWFVGTALLIALIEWYIYNRRVAL
jgi:hypothetical protein